MFLWFVIKLKHLTDVEVTEIMDYKTFENEVYLWIQANMSIYLCLRKKVRYNKACDEFIIIFNIITPICWSKSSSPSLFVSKHIQYNKYQGLLWCRYDNECWDSIFFKLAIKLLDNYIEWPVLLLSWYGMPIAQGLFQHTGVLDVTFKFCSNYCFIFYIIH